MMDVDDRKIQLYTPLRRSTSDLATTNIRQSSEQTDGYKSENGDPATDNRL
jgi:hypothetical protein